MEKSFCLSRTLNLLLIVFFVLQSNCQTKPPHVDTLSSSLDPSEEIFKLDDEIKEAQNRQWDILSPENFLDAQKALNKSKKLRDSGKADATILESLAVSKAWLKEAEIKAQRTESVLKDIKDARAGAIRAGAPKVLEADWKRLESKLITLTTAIEKGNLKPAEKSGEDITRSYRQMEVNAALKTYLAVADENIDSALRKNAQKLAPSSLLSAQIKRQEAIKIIQADPRNTPLIKRVASEANRESHHLINVLAKVKTGNSEQLVLLAEKQQERIANLQKEELSATKRLEISQRKLGQSEKLRMELIKEGDLHAKADHLKEHFDPKEVEVITENGNIKLRLKSLRFAQGQVQLTQKNKAFLKKVEDALRDLPSKKIVIEAYNDKREQANKGKVLSTKRAIAVQNYLTSLKNIDKDKFQSVGKGHSEPFTTGPRAEEPVAPRRVEILVETQ